MLPQNHLNAHEFDKLIQIQQQLEFIMQQLDVLGAKYSHLRPAPKDSSYVESQFGVTQSVVIDQFDGF